MGFKSFRLDLAVRDGVPAPAFATAIPQMFEALLDVFAPLDVTYQIDGGDFMRVTRLDPVRVFANEPLWCDEELTRDALTRCKPNLGTDVVTELYERFDGLAARSVDITAEGALLHRAAGTDEPAWYGRWRATHLRELYTFSFHWTPDPWRGFQLVCPLSGYPFTSVRPLVRGSLADGDPEIGAQNRALLFPALAKVRGALGFDPDEVSWDHEQVDYGSLYPHDRKDIARRWLPLLAASLVLLFACKKPSAASPVVAIELSWPGASAEVLEHGAVELIEQAVVPFARGIESRIAADHATVSVEVDDIDRAFADIRRLFPLRTLPPELPPVVLRRAREDDVPVMWLSVRGERPLVELSEIARDEVARDLERLPGVGQIELRGLATRTTVVRPDLDRLGATGIVVFDLLAILQSTSSDSPGELGDIVVRQSNGAVVRLRDVARIEDAIDRDGSGEPMLAIHAQHGVDAGDVIERVRAAIAKVPPGVTVAETASPLPPKRTPKLVVELRGVDPSALDAAADAITAALAAKRITDVVRDPGEAEAEETVVPDRVRAAALGVPMADVIATLRAIAGDRVGPIALRFEPRTLVDLIERVRVRGRDGLVPLSAIVTLGPTYQSSILRRDRERTIELAIFAPGAREVVKQFAARDGVRVIVSP